jgi:ABC-type Zn2+ transport system substrate-binding protein/surface adhesin
LCPGVLLRGTQFEREEEEEEEEEEEQEEEEEEAKEEEEKNHFQRYNRSFSFPFLWSLTSCVASGRITSHLTFSDFSET